MRLTILGRDFPPTIGGIADHTDLLAEELARRGIAVTVVCGAPADERARFDVRAAIDRWDTAGVPAIVAAVRATEPDAILWQYNPFNYGARGVPGRAPEEIALSLRSVARLVVMAHELWFPWGRAGVRGLAWATTQRIATYGVLRDAHAVVVTTAKREHELKRFGPKLHRIPVGSNIEPRAPQPGTRAMLGIDDGAFVAVHLGTAGPGKDLEPAFSAFRGLRDRAHLVLAGRGGAADVPRDLQDRVHVTGEKSREEISAILRAADCYLHPDHSGPSAGRRGSLVAALAHELPIVAFDGPDREPELVDGENVVIASPDSLTSALERLRVQPDLARKIGRSGRTLFERSFSWTRIAERLLPVLQGKT